MNLKKNLSAAARTLTDCRIRWLKNLLIYLFILIYKPNMQEALHSQLRHYISFNDFFTRRLKVNARPLSASAFVSPADGTLTNGGIIQHGRISAQATAALSAAGTSDSASPSATAPITSHAASSPSQPPSSSQSPIIHNIKGADYSVSELLGLDEDDPRVKSLSNGQSTVIYLAPHNYHRVHVPCAATLTLANFIPGELYSVNEKSVKRLPSLYAHNQRLSCVFATEYGMMAYVMVAALFVSSIGTAWGSVYRARSAAEKRTTPQKFNKGDELGYFEMGSTVVMLLENRDLSLVPNPNTLIKMGEPLFTI